MRIKVLGSSDYVNILIIWEKAVKATHDFLKEKDFELIKTTLPNILPKLNLFGIKENNKLLGFMGTSIDKIEALFVDPSYFGNGIGSCLVLYAIKEMYLKKVSVNKQNQKGFNFYKRFGFYLVSKDEQDSMNLPYPILHLELH